MTEGSDVEWRTEKLADGIEVSGPLALVSTMTIVSAKSFEYTSSTRPK